MPAAALCGVLLVAAPAGAADEVRPVGATGPIGSERLSDERTVTRFANSHGRAAIRHAPRHGARTVGRLRPWTEDGYREV